MEGPFATFLINGRNGYVFFSAGINSSPDSSHFVRHHDDDYLWREQPKILFLLLFAGHIHEKRKFCLLAEESPLILLANWSAAEAI